MNPCVPLRLRPQLQLGNDFTSGHLGFSPQGARLHRVHVIFSPTAVIVLREPLYFGLSQLNKDPSEDP